MGVKERTNIASPCSVLVAKCHSHQSNVKVLNWGDTELINVSCGKEFRAVTLGSDCAAHIPNSHIGSNGSFNGWFAPIYWALSARVALKVGPVPPLEPRKHREWQRWLRSVQRQLTTCRSRCAAGLKPTITSQGLIFGGWLGLSFMRRWPVWSNMYVLTAGLINIPLHVISIDCHFPNFSGKHYFRRIPQKRQMCIL